jgi:hypothetical protein
MRIPNSDSGLTLVSGAKVFLAVGDTPLSALSDLNQILNQGKDQDVLLWVYTPDCSQDGSWNQEAERDIREVVGSCDLLLVN